MIRKPKAESRKPNTVRVLALGVYAAGVAVPILVLFGEVVASSGPTAGASHGVGERSARPATPPTGAAPSLGLPPFDAYGPTDAPVFPDLELIAVDGGTPARIASRVEGPSILHLWSVACESCVGEWSEVEEFRARGPLGNADRPAVVSILVVPEEGDPAPAARAALETIRRDGWFGTPAKHVTADWAVSEDSVLSGAEAPTAAKPMTGYPETFLLDADLRIRLRLAGPAPWDDATWIHLLEMTPGLAAEPTVSPGGSSTSPRAAGSPPAWDSEGGPSAPSR